MSRLGRWAAVGAAVAGIATVAMWDVGSTDDPTVVAAPIDGAEIFHAKGCASCHRGPETSPPIEIGYPSLADASSWAGERKPGMSAEDYLLESIAAPDAFTSPAFSGNVGPGSAMPQLGLTAEEIDALVTYLLQPPASDG